jgi:hypothetical protein
MTIAPDRLDELDFPTPEIEAPESEWPDEYTTTDDLIAACQAATDEFVAAREEMFARPEEPYTGPSICWDCDAPHDGPAGRCQRCADALGAALDRERQVRMGSVTFAEIEDDQFARLAEIRRAHELMRTAINGRDQRDHLGRDWYCYCSPTRTQRLTAASRYSDHPNDPLWVEAVRRQRISAMEREAAAQVAFIEAVKQRQAPDGGRGVSPRLLAYATVAGCTLMGLLVFLLGAFL